MSFENNASLFSYVAVFCYTFSLSFRKFCLLVGRMTPTTGPRSPSWLTCWRNCPSSTEDCLILGISGSLQSMYPNLWCSLRPRNPAPDSQVTSSEKHDLKSDSYIVCPIVVYYASFPPTCSSWTLLYLFLIFCVFLLIGFFLNCSRFCSVNFL